MILTMLASDRSTVTPLSPPPHQGANRRIRHQPPANSELLLNGLASFELRRVFCSNEGACVRFPTYHCAAQMTAGRSSIPVGRIGPRAQVDPNPPSVLHARADRGCQLFTAKLGSALFHASGVRSVAGASSYPDGSAGTVGRVQRFKDAIA